MAEIPPRERMRRALSYAARARLDGDAQHVQAAQALLDSTRQALTRHAEQLGKKLRILFAHQSALNDNVMSGKIKPKQANEQNRKLAAQIAELRAAIAELNTVIAAQRADDLGGFIDLPLEKYAAQMAVGTQQKTGWRSISLRPTKAGFILWLVCFIAVIVGSLIYLRALPTLHPLQISAAMMPDGNVRVRVQNDTNHPIRLNVPRNDNAKSEGYNIEVSGKESADKASGDKPFSPTPTTGSWQYGSGIKQEPITTEIGPGFVEEFILRIDTLTENGHKPTALKIEITSARGRTIATATVSL